MRSQQRSEDQSKIGGWSPCHTTTLRHGQLQWYDDRIYFIPTVVALRGITPISPSAVLAPMIRVCNVIPYGTLDVYMADNCIEAVTLTVNILEYEPNVSYN